MRRAAGRLQESTDGGETWHHAAGVTGNGYHFTGRPAGEYRYLLAACYAAPAGNTGYCRETGWDPISVTVKYDTEDNLETNAVAGTLAYNTQSRLSNSTTALKVGTTNKTYVHRYTYDTHGRLRTTTYPTGLTGRSDYNAVDDLRPPRQSQDQDQFG